MGGLASIEAAGLLDAYTAVSPPDVRTAIQSAIAGMWIPVDIAVAHYLACDRMGVSSDTAAKLGRSTFARTKGLLLGTAVAVARGAGVTPWSLLQHGQRFWLRGNDGGGVRVLKVGPKEARVDIVGSPLWESRYFRAAYRGLVAALVQLVAQAAFAHEIPGGTSNTSIAVRVQWV